MHCQTFKAQLCSCHTLSKSCTHPPAPGNSHVLIASKGRVEERRRIEIKLRLSLRIFMAPSCPPHTTAGTSMAIGQRRVEHPLARAQLEPHGSEIRLQTPGMAHDSHKQWDIPQLHFKHFRSGQVKLLTKNIVYHAPTSTGVAGLISISLVQDRHAPPHS